LFQGDRAAAAWQFGAAGEGRFRRLLVPSNPNTQDYQRDDACEQNEANPAHASLHRPAFAEPKRSTIEASPRY
jgi:hypothetical protein